MDTPDTGFDLSTAQLVEDEGFDLSTAKPVGEIVKAGKPQKSASFSPPRTGLQFLAGMSKNIGEDVDALLSSVVKGNVFTGQMPDAAVAEASKDPNSFSSILLGQHPVTGTLNELNRRYLGNKNVPAPQNEVERMAGNAGDVATTALELLAPETVAAKAITKAPSLFKGVGKYTENITSRIVKDQLESSQKDLAKAAVGNVLAGAGQGAGEQLASDYGADPTGQALAGFAASLYPALSPTSFVKRGADYARKLVSASELRTAAGRKALMERISAKSAGKTIQNTMEVPQYADNFAEGNAIEHEIGLEPGGGFGVSRKTGDPRLLEAEASLNNEATGSTLQKLIDRGIAVAKGITNYGIRKGPVAVDDAPQVVLDMTDLHLKAEQADIEHEATQIAKGIVPTGMTPGEVGPRIRQQLTAIKDAQKAKLQQIAEASGLNDANTIFDEKPLEDVIESTLPGKNDVTKSVVSRYLRSLLKDTTVTVPGGKIEEGIPSAPITTPQQTALAEAHAAFPATPSSKAFAETQPPTAPTNVAGKGTVLEEQVPVIPEHISLSNLQRARTQMQQDIRTYRAGMGQEKNLTVADIQTARSILDRYLDTTAPMNADADLVNRWKSFRSQWKQYADKFERGVVYRILAPGGRKDFVTLDEKVAGQIFSPGNESGVKQYLLAGGDIPTLRAVALDSLRNMRGMIVDGQIQPKVYERWLKSHENPLKTAGLYDEFRSDGVVANNLGSRVNNIATRQAALEDNALNVALKASNRTPETFIKRAMTDPKTMQELVQVAKDNNALPALQRSVWEKVLPHGEMDPGKILDFLDGDATKRTVSQALSPEHIQSLRTIAKALQIEQRLRATPSGKSVDTDLLKQFGEMAGMGPMQIASRYVNIKSGRLSSKVALTDMFSRIFGKQYQQIKHKALQEALVNENVANVIAGGLKSRDFNVNDAKRINTVLVALGQPVMFDYYNPSGKSTDPGEKLPEGMLEKGNLDPYNRPILKNSDGSVSTAVTKSFNFDGREVLIPTVVNGKKLSDKDAVAHYKETGEHFGAFKDVASADAFSEDLHNRMAAKIPREKPAKTLPELTDKYSSAPVRGKIDRSGRLDQLKKAVKTAQANGGI